MLITVFDLETTGLLDNPESKVTELSVIEYDTEFKRDVRGYSYLIDNLFLDEQISPEITELTGITTEMIQRHGVDPEFAYLDFINSVNRSKGVCFASNGERFDKPMIMRECFHNGMEPPPITVMIDDFYDVPYPSNHKGRNLSHKAADHGFLNMRAHSGLSDVMTLIGIIEKGGYSWEDMLESAKHPLVIVEALVEFKHKHLASERSFKWNQFNDKKWTRIMRKYVLDQEKDSFPFHYTFKNFGEQQ